MGGKQKSTLLCGQSSDRHDISVREKGRHVMESLDEVNHVYVICLTYTLSAFTSS